MSYNEKGKMHQRVDEILINFVTMIIISLLCMYARARMTRRIRGIRNTLGLARTRHAKR